MQSEPAAELPATHRRVLTLTGTALLAAFALGIVDTAQESGRAPNIQLEPLVRGQTYFAAGNLRAAVLEFEAASAILTTDPAPLLALATTLGKLGKPGPQLAAVREAVRRAPDDARSQFALGTALAEAGETTNAIAALERSLELAPDGLEARVNLGILELRVERPAVALQHFERVLAIDPRHKTASAAAIEARTQLGRANRRTQTP